MPVEAAILRAQEQHAQGEGYGIPHRHMQFAPQQKQHDAAQQQGKHLKKVDHPSRALTQAKHVPVPPLHSGAKNRLVVGEQHMFPVGIVHPLIMDETAVVTHMPHCGGVILDPVGRSAKQIFIGRPQPGTVF